MSDIWVEQVEPLDGPASRPHDDGQSRVREPVAARIPGTRISLEWVPPLDVSVLFHPLRWMRWRRELKRLGPYAPDYEGRFVQVDGAAQRLIFAAVLVAVFATVIALA
jgi:hypothetical protein